MRIGIDARIHGLKHTGIGRYTMELIKWLARIDDKNQYFIFARNSESEFPSVKNFKIIKSDIRHYTLSEQLKFPRVIKKHNLDLVHFPHFNVPLLIGTPFVVTIHDLLWHEVLGYNVTTLNFAAYTAKYLGYRLVVKNAVKKAKKIITPSKWVKNQVTKRFSLDENKVAVTYEGVDKIFKSKDINKSSPVKISKPFFVYTGSLYPHKNVDTILKSLALINRTQHKKASLVLVSARSIFTSKIKNLSRKLKTDQRVNFAGFLSDQDLVSLYQQATALIQPSKSEGFGLTGLEAMAAGLPVIASTSASLPEVYEEAAVYFDPESHKELAEKMTQLLKKPDLRQQLRLAGRRQAFKYSWKKMAQQTLQVYRDILIN